MKISVLIITVLFNAIAVLATIHNVNVANFQFTQANLTIQQGDTVRWTNTSGTHNVRHNSATPIFRSGNPAGPGMAWPYSFAFTEAATPPGVYNYICELHAPDMSGSITVQPLAANERPDRIPNQVELQQNYPNPFNAQTTISFSLPTVGAVKLTLLNVLGQTVATLVDGQLSAGTHVVPFQAGNIGSGIYFYQLQTPQSTLIRKMLFLQ